MTTNYIEIESIAKCRLDLSEIDAELALAQKPKEMVCLGCSAKIALVETVYPALKELQTELKSIPQIRFEPREDAYLFDSDGKSIELRRAVYPVKLLEENDPVWTAKAAQLIREFKPEGVVLLVCLTASPSKEVFKSGMMSYYRALVPGFAEGQYVSVGKGHSIQIAKTREQMYLVADYIKTEKGSFYGVANNDTISTIDPNLKHSSWISVFVGINNALNDLFTEGVWQNIEIHPTFDTRIPEEEVEIRAAFKKFEATFKDYGIKMVDCEKLGFSTNSNGATVIGVTDREPPRNRALAEGDVLIATRPIGDLAPLTEYLIRQSLEEDTAEIEKIRRDVLQWMLIPNFSAGKIIANYLPAKGEKHDPAKHINSSRDMTGPGILAVEELSEDSGVDVYLDNIELWADWIADVQMPNPTSGTNGAIIVAAQPEVAANVMKDFATAGYKPWIIGKVRGKSEKPAILINEKLKRYQFLVGVQKGIFANYRFVPEETVTL